MANWRDKNQSKPKMAKLYQAMDYLTLRKQSATDDMINSVPRPRRAIIPNAPPLWDQIALNQKLPAPKWPTGLVELSRDRVGRALWRTDGKLDFALYDPNGYEFRFEYEPLHDPNLKDFFSRGCIMERLQTLGYVTPSYGATCSLKQFNDYRRFLNRVHQYYVERQRRKLAEKTLLANQLAHAENNARKDREKAIKQMQVEMQRRQAEERLRQERTEKRQRQAERERRSYMAQLHMEQRMLSHQADTIEATRMQSLKTARMQLLAKEIQWQREVDNKMRWHEKEGRFRQKRREAARSKKAWQEMRDNLNWETVIERQQKMLERRDYLLSKQKVMFDFNVRLRKRIVDYQRASFAKKFERYRRVNCLCDSKANLKKKGRKHKRGPAGDLYQDYEEEMGSDESESEEWEEEDEGQEESEEDDDNDDDNESNEGGDSKAEDDDESGSKKDPDEDESLEQKEQVVQSVVGVYVRRNVSQLLQQVARDAARLMMQQAKDAADDSGDGRSCIPHRTSASRGSAGGSNSMEQEGPSVKRKSYQVYRVMQGKQQKPVGQKRHYTPCARFPKTRSVTFGQTSTVGLGSMYIEPGKDLKSTKDRPPTPVTSLETLAAAVSSAPWDPFSPLHNLFPKVHSLVPEGTINSPTEGPKTEPTAKFQEATEAFIRNDIQDFSAFTKKTPISKVTENLLPKYTKINSLQKPNTISKENTTVTPSGEIKENVDSKISALIKEARLNPRYFGNPTNYRKQPAGTKGPCIDVINLINYRPIASKAPGLPSNPFNQKVIDIMKPPAINRRVSMKSQELKTNYKIGNRIGKFRSSPEGLEGVISDPEGLLLDVTLDRVRRRLISIVRQRLGGEKAKKGDRNKVSSGLDANMKRLFSELASKDKSLTMTSVAANLTAAILRLDAKDILDADELRYAADAIAYDLLALEEKRKRFRRTSCGSTTKDNRRYTSII